MLHAPTTGELNDIQRAFFDRIGAHEQFLPLFDHLPDVYFLIKDSESRFVHVSTTLSKRLLGDSPGSVAGKTDYDFFATDVADHFVADDRIVLASGLPLLGRVELWYNEHRQLDWFTTNKYPLFDNQRKVIGLMGTVRGYGMKRETSRQLSRIDAVVEYIRQNCRRQFSITELAGRAGMSTRQLAREFQNVFGVSVQQFVIKTRLESIKVALARSKFSVAEIANQFGYCDQSAMTHQFRKHLGITPLQYRRQYGTEL